MSRPLRRTDHESVRFLTPPLYSSATMLAAAAWPLWAHTMTTMPAEGGNGENPALRLAEPYKLKLAINKSAVCLARRGGR